MVTEIKLLSSGESLSPLTFPFEHLQNSLLSENYKESLLKFAEYYFSQLTESNEDYTYGPLNPLLICLYHEDVPLLGELLDKYKYPSKVHGYFSPIYFCVKYRLFSALKKICKKLNARDHLVYFSREDFKCLLSSNLTSAHKLMASIPSTPLLEAFPKSMRIKDSNTRLFYVRQVKDLLFQVRDTGKPPEVSTKKRSLFKRVQDSDTQRDLEVEVECFEVPFKYCYDMGTPDSVQLLETFSGSTCEEFLLSEWKEVVNHKWARHWPAHVLMAILFWTFTLVCALSLIFFPESRTLHLSCLGFVGFFGVFEMVQILSYCSFKFEM